MKPIKIFLLFFLVAFTGVLNAQERQKADTTGKVQYKKGKPYVVVMNDGTEYVGEVLEDNGREILVNVKKKGKIYIPKYVVKTIEPLDKENYQYDEYLNENLFPRYYMLGTNALPFKKREFNAQLHYYIFGSCYYNVNENIALGVNSTWWGSPISLGAKSSFKISEGHYVGVDLHGGTVVYNERMRGTLFGHIEAKYTGGDANSNYTFSTGLFNYSYKPYNSYSYYPPYNPNITQQYVSYYVNIMTAQRLNKRNMFVGEGWIFPEDNFGMLGFGIRSLKKESSSFAFGMYGLFRLKEIYGNYTFRPFLYRNNVLPVIPIPYLGICFKL